MLKPQLNPALWPTVPPHLKCVRTLPGKVIWRARGMVYGWQRVIY